MSNVVIKVEDVSKQYRLGKVGTGTIVHDLRRWWHISRGKEDPYLKLGEENDRSKRGESEYVWALKDISFDVKQGDVVGIIGRNGAGKSTLLKILSRTTAPTTGSIRVKGRIASLLEVGTGFHPDLSGRENIFLNGAILGMTKPEIKSKLDEIIDFSGVERYIDTPVKRYSSGMYVRLAFAVAAHLEPEILIVDEVLAVGDAEFQKKALGKIKNVSEGEGRTVIFVSHNIGAIKNLCKRGIFLAKGLMKFNGDVINAVNEYQAEQESGNQGVVASFRKEESDSIDISILEADLKNINGLVTGTFEFDEDIYMRILYRVRSKLSGSLINFIVSDFNQNLCMSFDIDNDHETFQLRTEGLYETFVKIPSQRFKVGIYNISVGAGIANKIAMEQIHKCLRFEIVPNHGNYLFSSFYKDRIGVVPMVLTWKTKKVVDNVRIP